MSQVATRQTGAISAATPPPQPPEPVARYLADLSAWQEARERWSHLPDAAQPFAWDGGARPVLPTLDASGRIACADAADDYAAALGRLATPGEVADWLRPMNAGVANPMDREGFALRASAIAQACADLPAAAFTEAARREVLAACKWFPAAAEVVRVIKPVAARWRREMQALEAASRPPERERPASSPAPDAPASATTREERAAHAAAAVRSLKAAIIEADPIGNGAAAPADEDLRAYLTRRRAEAARKPA